MGFFTVPKVRVLFTHMAVPACSFFEAAGGIKVFSWVKSSTSAKNLYIFKSATCYIYEYFCVLKYLQ
jgi:hypothetical protein